MNNVKTLENIFSAVADDSSFSLLLNGHYVRLYRNGKGEWCLGNDETGDHYLSTEFENFIWNSDIVFFNYRGEEMDLQVIRVQNLTKFRCN